MKEYSVPVIIVTEQRDDVEYFNKTMRDAGHPVRCRGVSLPQDLDTLLAREPPHLLIFFADSHPTSLQEICKIRQQRARTTPLIVLAQTADETSISEAQQIGANDLVSRANQERIRKVCERELKTFRLERALNDSLKTTRGYKDQLRSFMSSSSDAIAQVQEGIIVEANQTWSKLLCNENPENALGPLMDFFAERSQATLKGAFAAAARGQWDGSTLEVEAITQTGQAIPVELQLRNSTHDGDPAIRLDIRRRPKPEIDRSPVTLVQQAPLTDPVTGFCSRQRFVELLTDKLNQHNHNGARALAFVRPDRFAAVERAVGPLASEDLLGQLAGVFRRLLGEADVAGRFGGTVFTFVIERASLGDIQSWAENAINRVSEEIFEVTGRSMSLSCSIGLAEMGEGTDLVEDLIRNAERANRSCREEGGNRVIIEETNDETTRIKRIDGLWVHQIRSALVEGRFRLFHMNIANLEGRAERMFDTVLRMIDEQGDEIPASEFIPAASRNRLLRPIDRWVIDASFDYCGREAPDLVMIKLTHESILDATLLKWVTEKIQTTGLRPDCLCFQVSEEDASQYQKQTVALANALRRLGCRFAVENFGTGRDPLRVLTNTPMDFVKFDGSFMQRIADDLATQDQLRAFVSCAGRNGIKTIAARVENANTMAVLFQLGVGYMQGHYLHAQEVVLEEAI